MMTLRDQFAVKAMEALIISGRIQNDEDPAKIIAIGAYAVADSMLKERNRDENDKGKSS